MLPELIQGAWTSLVILTYGADLSFFETHLLRQLSQVPLRVVLADGGQLDATLQSAAASGQRLSQANRTYLAAPIRHGHAAHAKAILMTTSTEGRLLVGSGNLNQQGYAAPGELWHVYAYNDERTDHLPEFAAVRSLIDTAAGRGLLDPPSIELLDHIWTETPWIPATHGGLASVRHNHDVALIDQLHDAAKAITGPIQTLTVHAPFYDPDTAALDQLITRLRPKQVRVLLTQNTSVDPAVLQTTLARLGKRAELYEIAVTGDTRTYLHAKWVHLVGIRDEVLLTGSANLSRSALLATSANGNIEIGVIQHRACGGFADLYAPLSLKPIRDLAALGLKFHESPELPSAAGPAALMWSRLDGRSLTLVFDATVDETDLHITGPDGTEITAVALTRIGTTVTLTLTAADAELLAAGGPIAVRLSIAEGAPEHGAASWPYQLGRLTERLRTAGRNRILAKTGTLPEIDKDLYELLTQLEQTLITDPLSAWKIVHPATLAPTVEQDGEPISWDDIDWERLKRSPRYAAYHYTDRARINPTDIEIILASIAGQLNPGQPDSTGPTDPGEAEDDELGNESTEVGADPEQAEAQEAGQSDTNEDTFPRQLSVSTRTRMAFGRFVTRYTKALGNADFIDMLGPTLTVHNAVIMHHLLHRLTDRDGIDPVKAAGAYLAIWHLLWGVGEARGLIADLAPDERAAADLVIAQGRLRTMTLHALAQTSFDDVAWAEFGYELRDQVRSLLVNPTFGLDTALIREAAPLRGQATQLLEDLRQTASYLHDDEVRALVLEPFGLAASAAIWESQRVRRRAAKGHPAHDGDVQVLEVRGTVPGLTVQSAIAALERLAMATRLKEDDLNYVRIRFGEAHNVCFWDQRAKTGLCCIADSERELDDLRIPWPDWWLRLVEIRTALAHDIAA